MCKQLAGFHQGHSLRKSHSMLKVRIRYNKTDMLEALPPHLQGGIYFPLGSLSLVHSNPTEERKELQGRS